MVHFAGYRQRKEKIACDGQVVDVDSAKHWMRKDDGRHDEEEGYELKQPPKGQGVKMGSIQSSFGLEPKWLT